MWAVNMPYYSEYKTRSPGKDGSKLQHSVPPSRTGDAHDSPSATDLLEPAVDGPPSPERLRQLSKQMKRASHLNRPLGHRAVSSSSSSIRSFTGERPAWESALDNVSLMRRPSDRSTDRSTSSRERPESVQVFGKNLFHRRGRSKRESTSASPSPGSSLYSAEFSSDGAFALKDSLMPTIFARRKPSRDETAAQKKLQISGPFNFQHVTHTQRENIPSIQRGSRMELAAEFSAMRTPGPVSAPGALHGIEAHEIGGAHDNQLGIFNLPAEEEDQPQVPLTAPLARPPLKPRHTAPAGPRRLVKQARSQDQLRASPPRSTPTRPPRSPADPPSSASWTPPVPPPRISSRQSLQPESLALSALQRPQTSGGFTQPRPFSPHESPDASPPPATSHGFMPAADFAAFGSGHSLPIQSLTRPDEGTWPLATPAIPSAVESPLPDVPEEEEPFGLPRSRVSLASNNSSLRGSQSVPMLRSVAEDQRPMSGASETLGRFDMVAAQRAMRAGMHADGGVDDTASLRESWEDVIDYCYEHEAEADCEYQWDRSSEEGPHNGMSAAAREGIADEELALVRSITEEDESPSKTPEVNSNRASTIVRPETTTPTPFLSPSGVNNFSLPRFDKKGHRPSMLKPMRPISIASSFKESQGFTLSPSLLIPGDYHQEMLKSEAEKYEYVDDLTNGGGFHVNCMEGATSRGGKSPLVNEQRVSTSTTETNSTSHSDSTGERHVSANSTWTNLTRLTAGSSTSLNKMAGSWSEAAPSMPSASPDTTPVTRLVDCDQSFDDTEEATPPATKDTVPEMTAFPPMGGAPFHSGLKRSMHKSHASESVAMRADVPLPAKTQQDAPSMRRPRARTTSLSAQAPPVGQYALFPRNYVKPPTGDRI